MDRIEDILEDIRNGKMVIMMDDEDRENEGDLIMAADKVRPEDINFMARNGRGLICLTLTQERCRQLRLPLMVSETNESLSTNFTVSIEAAEGVTTGISAHDRAHTVLTAVADGAQPQDLVQPGHIFPLMAQPGGVLTRAGHTEAGCDLARLADCEPAAVIVEILNDDGTMARLPDLQEFAKEHGLKIGTIADLIRYRMEKEKTVEIISEREVETEYGNFRAVCFEDHINRTVHFALVNGEVKPEEPTLVRVHLQDTLGDVMGLNWRSLGWPLKNAMKRIAADGGVLVILRPGENPGDLASRFQQGDAPVTNTTEDGDTVLRTYGVGAQILTDLGVRKMRVLSAPKRMQGISGFGLEVVEYVDSD
ncbi:MAG: bifunctional 3,4-dihydroxy-2-butanone-4-phosphate synthase/GTP cyclohydrolase II [Gammaproteobacteria bacterium]|nr:bifunctional 3,4-dihydroxy-2-butanone-4-phosphate synthase/GTP cyclohydrolase II [Gammaproteobacteria bacterium]